MDLNGSVDDSSIFLSYISRVMVVALGTFSISLFFMLLIYHQGLPSIVHKKYLVIVPFRNCLPFFGHLDGTNYTKML
jgi:hypothetical protein